MPQVAYVPGVGVIYVPGVGVMAGCCCVAGCACRATGVKLTYAGIVPPPDCFSVAPSSKRVGSPNGSFTVTFPLNDDGSRQCGVFGGTFPGLFTEFYSGASCTGSVTSEPVSLDVAINGTDAGGVFVFVRGGYFSPALYTSDGASAQIPIHCCSRAVTIPGAIVHYPLPDGSTFVGGGGTLTVQLVTDNTDPCRCDECCDVYDTNLYFTDGTTRISVKRGINCNWGAFFDYGADSAQVSLGKTSSAQWTLKFQVTDPAQQVVCLATWHAPAVTGDDCPPSDGWALAGYRCTIAILAPLPNPLQVTCGDPPCPATMPGCCDKLLLAFDSETLNPCWSETAVIASRTAGSSTPEWTNSLKHVRVFCDRGKLCVEIDVSNSICGDCPGTCFIRYESTAWDGACPDSVTDNSFTLVRDDLGGAPNLLSIRCTADCTTNCTVCCTTMRFHFAGGDLSGKYEEAFDNDPATCDWSENGNDIGDVIGFSLTCTAGVWTLSITRTSDPTHPYTWTANADADGCPDADPAAWSETSAHGVDVASIDCT